MSENRPGPQPFQPPQEHVFTITQQELAALLGLLSDLRLQYDYISKFLPDGDAILAPNRLLLETLSMKIRRALAEKMANSTIDKQVRQSDIEP